MASSEGTRLGSVGGPAVVLFLEESVGKAFSSPQEIHHHNWLICVSNAIYMYKTHPVMHS